jgi:chromosome segregation ATPase
MESAIKSLFQWFMSVSCIKNSNRLDCMDSQITDIKRRLSDTYNREAIDERMKGIENQILFQCEQVKHELRLQVNDCEHKIEHTDHEIRNIQDKQAELKEIQLHISDKIQQNSENLHSILGFLEKPTKRNRPPFR